MRISDWSSDVCSSDLIDRQVRVDLDPAALQALGVTAGDVSQQLARIQVERAGGKAELDGEQQVIRTVGTIDSAKARSEERRVGKECVSPCRSRWAPYH